MEILLIDNYDSFTYNLLHLLQRICGANDRVEVIYNDRIEVSQAVRFDALMLSPGPGIPSEAGRLMQIIDWVAPCRAILGVCLGHQAIAEAFGAHICRCSMPQHGIQSEIRTATDVPLFEGLSRNFRAGRYHSWLVDRESLPDTLRVTATDAQGNVMALSHRSYNVHGVQFHPESFMTDGGDRIVRNFLNMATWMPRG